MSKPSLIFFTALGSCGNRFSKKASPMHSLSNLPRVSVRSFRRLQHCPPSEGIGCAWEQLVTRRALQTMIAKRTINSRGLRFIFFFSWAAECRPRSLRNLNATGQKRLSLFVFFAARACNRSLEPIPYSTWPSAKHAGLASLAFVQFDVLLHEPDGGSGV